MTSIIRGIGSRVTQVFKPKQKTIIFYSDIYLDMDTCNSRKCKQLKIEDTVLTDMGFTPDVVIVVNEDADDAAFETKMNRWKSYLKELLNHKVVQIKQCTKLFKQFHDTVDVLTLNQVQYFSTPENSYHHMPNIRRLRLGNILYSRNQSMSIMYEYGRRFGYVPEPEPEPTVYPQILHEVADYANEMNGPLRQRSNGKSYQSLHPRDIINSHRIHRNFLNRTRVERVSEAEAIPMDDESPVEAEAARSLLYTGNIIEKHAPVVAVHKHTTPTNQDTHDLPTAIPVQGGKKKTKSVRKSKTLRTHKHKHSRTFKRRR